MMVDLDNFKPLNDTHGHAAGDLLLVEVARRLQGCVRNTDTVARLGGDEFIVLLTLLTGNEEAVRSEASAVAGKILRALASPYRLQGPAAGSLSIEHRCSSSIGVVIFGSADREPGGIVRRADAAMYAAKRAGRNHICLAGAEQPEDTTACPRTKTP